MRSLSACAASSSQHSSCPTEQPSGATSHQCSSYAASKRPCAASPCTATQPTAHACICNCEPAPPSTSLLARSTDTSLQGPHVFALAEGPCLAQHCSTCACAPGTQGGPESYVGGGPWTRQWRAEWAACTGRVNSSHTHWASAQLQLDSSAPTGSSTGHTLSQSRTSHCQVCSQLKRLQDLTEI